MSTDRRLPLWSKILYGSFLCVLVPVYWRSYGPANFLWASDISLFFVFVALWSERPLANSMMAVGVLPFEIAWVIDFLAGSQLFGVAAYMFEADRPLYLRGLSLFHMLLPPIMVFLLLRLGYDRRALAAQTLLAWVVLPLTYLFTDPHDNINLVFGPGREPQQAMSPLLYLALEMILLPLVYLPTHLLLRRLLDERGTEGAV
jgi:hypothetical protein